jgi:diguanylate cyclase (GGDEF)-like protein
LIRLAQNVSGDLNAHTTKIEAISADLRGTDRFLLEARILVENAPDRILAANRELQQQLASAKQQIEFQAAQLRVRESEARTDLVTMLFNRRAFEEELGRQLGIWERKSVQFALLMMDLDDFKRLNDTHGHQVGDDVLREVAQLIGGQLRGMDIAYRYGGEEFAVILPSTNAADACLVAERIRKAIEQYVLSSNDMQLSVTASMGVAHAITSDQSVAIIRRADEALYAAKQSGKNRIMWHNGKETLPSECREESSTPKTLAALERRPAQRVTLTGLNRELTKCVCESRRSNTPLSLICVRIDNKYSRKGTSGQAGSGPSLSAIIEVFFARLHEGDLLAPTGAAEFVVVLPGQSYDSALDLIEELVACDAINAADGTHDWQLRYEACELRPNETAEQLLIRGREGLLVAGAAC